VRSGSVRHPRSLERPDAADGRHLDPVTRPPDPDILLTDIEMLGRSGLDVAAEVRRRGLGTRVVNRTAAGRVAHDRGWL